MEVEIKRDDGTRLGQNTFGKLRAGPYGELIVNDGGCGRFFEAARYERIFHTFQSALTIAATHNLGLDNAADTAIIGIYNPISSGKAAVMLDATFTSISGTPPASSQPVWYLAYNQTAITAANTGTFVNTINPALSSAMLPKSNIALAGLNTVTSNNPVRMWGGAAFAGALAANHDVGYRDDIDGRLVVAPGCLLALMAGTAAGTTWIVSAGATWAEVDWPL